MTALSEQIDSLQTFHEAQKSNADVKFLHFWVENIESLVNFKERLITSIFPNLVGYVIEGYELSDTNRRKNNINLKENLKRGNFKGFEPIKRIGINYCNLESLPEDVFHDLTALEEINLHDNKIRELPSKLLSKNIQLLKFDAHENLIERVPRGFFDFLDNLRYVNLNNNKITKIGAKLKILHANAVVHLDGNVCFNGVIEIGKMEPSQLDQINHDCSSSFRRFLYKSRDKLTQG